MRLWMKAFDESVAEGFKRTSLEEETQLLDGCSLDISMISSFLVNNDSKASMEKVVEKVEKKYLTECPGTLLTPYTFIRPLIFRPQDKLKVTIRTRDRPLLRLFFNGLRTRDAV
jgi:hypothetical protein